VKILLIRLRLIGDVVFTTPAVAAVRRRFPDAHITYLVEAAAAPILRHNRNIDELIVAERPRGTRRILYDLALARRLRARRFDLVVDFHGGPRSAWLARATGAPQRVGYAVPGRAWLYTTRVPWSPSLVPPRHSVANQWDLVAPLGVDAADPTRYPVEMPADDDALRAVAQRLADHGVTADSRVVVIHVSATSPFRRWPRERFAQVAATLAQDATSCHVVITSGPSESDAGDDTAAVARAAAGAAASRILRCGEFNLPELRALIERAALYVGGDSGPLHVAATTATPIVALFGPTVPERSTPWRDPAAPTINVDVGPLPCRPCDQRHCIPGDFRCLNTLPTERVIAAARQLLAHRGPADIGAAVT
jgi:predicted lipopolysaccharide heptosyltransferase III